jgi:hypothetical protein
VLRAKINGPQRRNAGEISMKLRCLVLLVLLVSVVAAVRAADNSPDVVVRNLYKQVVARKPIGIPKGADKSAMWPFLSKKLIHQLEVAQSCEVDYFRQHPKSADEKPEFDWLEFGLFSGANERAAPSAVVVTRTGLEKNGSYRVYLRLTYKDSVEVNGRKSDPTNTFHWNVAAAVITEGEKFVVDDVFLFKDNSTKIDSRLTSSFPGCDGEHWMGEKPSGK